MSLDSTISRVSYPGSGSANVFAYTFRIIVEEHLLATVREDATGAETTLVLSTDYTVDGVQNDGGGDVTLTDSGQPWIDGSSFLATGWSLTVRRVVPLLQETDIRNQGDYFAALHEDQFDLLVMADQQQQDEIDRSVRNPETLSPDDFDPTLPENINTPERALVTNAAGDGFSIGVVEAVDFERIFKEDTFENLNALALAAPTKTRLGYATDDKQYIFYTTDLTQGEQGWIVLG